MKEVCMHQILYLSMNALSFYFSNDPLQSKYRRKIRECIKTLVTMWTACGYVYLWNLKDVYVELYFTFLCMTHSFIWLLRSHTKKKLNPSLFSRIALQKGPPKRGRVLKKIEVELVSRTLQVARLAFSGKSFTWVKNSCRGAGSFVTLLRVPVRKRHNYR